VESHWRHLKLDQKDCVKVASSWAWPELLARARGVGWRQRFETDGCRRSLPQGHACDARARARQADDLVKRRQSTEHKVRTAR
jgi:hypothetical protein